MIWSRLKVGQDMFDCQPGHLAGLQVIFHYVGGIFEKCNIGGFPSWYRSNTPLCAEIWKNIGNVYEQEEELKDILKYWRRIQV